jgi:hypothetical protein
MRRSLKIIGVCIGISAIVLIASITISYRRAELEAAVVAGDRHLSKLFEGWIVAAAARRKFAVRISAQWRDVSLSTDVASATALPAMRF